MLVRGGVCGGAGWVNCWVRSSLRSLHRRASPGGGRCHLLQLRIAVECLVVLDFIYERGCILYVHGLGYCSLVRSWQFLFLFFFSEMLASEADVMFFYEYFEGAVLRVGWEPTSHRTPTH